MMSHNSKILMKEHFWILSGDLKNVGHPRYGWHVFGQPITSLVVLIVVVRPEVQLRNYLLKKL